MTALRVLPDPAAVCAELLLAAASAGGRLVLAGGTTPRPAYERAAADPVKWRTATVWFSDERCVSPKDARSNYRMVQTALLSRLHGGARPDVHRIRGELGPRAAADEYERRLQGARPPRFDLVLLGLGADGHTASLFPGQESLLERERLAVGIERPGQPPLVPRVSLTLPALASTARVVFLVTGAEKADAVAAAFGAGACPDLRVPASMLAPLVGEVLVLLDAAAASRL
ncbi:MAG TPA: 6-phosphogluconolactonase [Solirubrobacteraceae bacterium]